MSETERLNISADLRRVSWWLQTGNLRLAQRFIDRFKTDTRIKTYFGNKSFSDWIKNISDKTKDIKKRSESALTLSLLMK